MKIQLSEMDMQDLTPVVRKLVLLKSRIPRATKNVPRNSKMDIKNAGSAFQDGGHSEPKSCPPRLLQSGIVVLKMVQEVVRS